MFIIVQFQRALFGLISTRLSQWEILLNWILKRSALTFTFGLKTKTWFKVAAHPLPQNSDYVNYKPEIDKGNVNNALQNCVV